MKVIYVKNGMPTNEFKMRIVEIPDNSIESKSNMYTILKKADAIEESVPTRAYRSNFLEYNEQSLQLCETMDDLYRRLWIIQIEIDKHFKLYKPPAK